MLTAFAIFAIVYVINGRFGFFSIPQEETSMREYQFNLITVSTVFAGFSFTVLGMLLSLSSAETMQVLKETSILSTQCNVVADSIIMFIISTFFSLFFIFIAYSDFIIKVCLKVTLFDCHEMIISVAYIAGIGYLVYGIILFAVSVKKMIIIMQQIFENDIKKGRKKAEKFQDATKKQKDNMNKFQQEDYERDTFSSE